MIHILLFNLKNLIEGYEMAIYLRNNELCNYYYHDIIECLDSLESVYRN